MALKPGDMAPDFTLPATIGEKVTVARDIGQLLEKTRAA